MGPGGPVRSWGGEGGSRLRVRCPQRCSWRRCGRARARAAPLRRAGRPTRSAASKPPNAASATDPTPATTPAPLCPGVRTRGTLPPQTPALCSPLFSPSPYYPSWGGSLPGLVCSDFPYTYWFPFFCQFAPSRCVGHFYYAKVRLGARGGWRQECVGNEGLRYPSPSLSPSWAKGLSISIKELLQSSLSLEGPDLSRPNGISPGPLDKAPPGPKAQAKAPALPRPSPEAGAKAPSGPGPGAVREVRGLSMPRDGPDGPFLPHRGGCPSLAFRLFAVPGSWHYPRDGCGGWSGSRAAGPSVWTEGVSHGGPLPLPSLQTLPHDAALLVLCFALLRDSCTRSPAAWAWQRIENETLGFGDTVCDSHGRRHLSSCPLCAFCSLKLEQCQEESTLKREFCGPSHQTPFSSPFLASGGGLTKGLYYGLEVFGGLRMAFWCGRLAVQGCEETRVSGWLQAEFLSFQRGDFPTKICDSNKVEYPNYCAFKSRQCLLYSRDSQKVRPPPPTPNPPHRNHAPFSPWVGGGAETPSRLLIGWANPRVGAAPMVGVTCTQNPPPSPAQVFRQSCQRNESYSQLSEASAEEAVLSWSREFGRLTQG
uniref:Acrosin-binding protein n=1 Tax=Ornithorhynchus anatinus TaxID=9258 RepID=A0A6I8PBM0_ORNAN